MKLLFVKIAGNRKSVINNRYCWAERCIEKGKKN